MAAHLQRDDLHGIYMTEEAFERLISVESPYRYELIDGVVYNTTGSTPEHSIIASDVEGLLREQLGRSGPCRTHRDQYVGQRIGGQAFAAPAPARAPSSAHRRPREPGD